MITHVKRFSYSESASQTEGNSINPYLFFFFLQIPHYHRLTISVDFVSCVLLRILPPFT